MWPFSKRAPPKRRYNCYDWQPPWRRHGFNLPGFSKDEICQCDLTQWENDRSRCHIHGPTGRELYETLKAYGNPWGKQ